MATVTVRVFFSYPGVKVKNLNVLHMCKKELAVGYII